MSQASNHRIVQSLLLIVWFGIIIAETTPSVESQDCGNRPQFYDPLNPPPKVYWPPSTLQVIDQSDSIFSSLRLWRDSNHNGFSEPDELSTLREIGLATVECDYKESKQVDQYGNQFRYRSKIKDIHGAQLGRWAWDVFLTTAL
jgi:hypothetical protein